MTELNKIRARIDALDEQIQALITERAKCAVEVARHKVESNGLAPEPGGIYRPEREAEVLRKVIARNAGPLDDETLARVFREVMSACRALQHPITVAYLGPAGTFTQAAALKHFGASASTSPLDAIDQVFREVEAGHANYGVVPVENSTEGVVSHTLDSFLRSGLKICGEVELRIHHHILAQTPDLAKIKRVYAHQQALGQCRAWLDAHVPTAERLPANSNADAARRAAKEKGAAAIASETAAHIYGLAVVAANIEDEPNNTTRFLVIGRRMPPPSGDDKTSLLLSTTNKPGGLHRLLKPFADNGISLTRIESRPSRQGMWDYVFFVDVVGHVNDPKVAAALKVLEAEASMLKVLGSYPKAVV